MYACITRPSKRAITGGLTSQLGFAHPALPPASLQNLPLTDFFFQILSRTTNSIHKRTSFSTAGYIRGPVAVTLLRSAPSLSSSHSHADQDHISCLHYICAFLSCTVILEIPLCLQCPHKPCQKCICQAGSIFGGSLLRSRRTARLSSEHGEHLCPYVLSLPPCALNHVNIATAGSQDKCH